MTGIFAFFAAFVACALASRLQNVFEYKMKVAEKKTPQLKSEFNNILHGITEKKIADMMGRKKLKLQDFSWTDCGSASAVVHIKSLSITPDPIASPISVEASFTIGKTLVAPLKGSLLLKKKLGFLWIEVPCIDGLGSCTYDDLCEKLSQVTVCPEPLKKIGIDCTCPLKASSYSLPKTEFSVNLQDVPSGEYRLTVDVTQNSGEVACLDIYITIK